MATIKDFARMCKSNKDRGFCKDTCPFYYCKEDKSCLYYMTHCTKEAEDIINMWVLDHPFKTYADDFFKKFPKARKDEYGAPYDICVNNLYRAGVRCDGICNECWMREYKEADCEK